MGEPVQRNCQFGAVVEESQLHGPVYVCCIFSPFVSYGLLTFGPQYLRFNDKITGMMLPRATKIQVVTGGRHVLPSLAWLGGTRGLARVASSFRQDATIEKEVLVPLLGTDFFLPFASLCPSQWAPSREPSFGHLTVFPLVRFSGNPQLLFQHELSRMTVRDVDTRGQVRVASSMRQAQTSRR